MAINNAKVIRGLVALLNKRLCVYGCVCVCVGVSVYIPVLHTRCCTCARVYVVKHCVQVNYKSTYFPRRTSGDSYLGLATSRSLLKVRILEELAK